MGDRYSQNIVKHLCYREMLLHGWNDKCAYVRKVADNCKKIRKYWNEKIIACVLISNNVVSR